MDFADQADAVAVPVAALVPTTNHISVIPPIILNGPVEGTPPTLLGDMATRVVPAGVPLTNIREDVLMGEKGGVAD